MTDTDIQAGYMLS